MKQSLQLLYLALQAVVHARSKRSSEPGICSSECHQGRKQSVLWKIPEGLSHALSQKGQNKFTKNKSTMSIWTLSLQGEKLYRHNAEPYTNGLKASRLRCQGF